MITLWITWATCALLIGVIYAWIGKAPSKKTDGEKNRTRPVFVAASLPGQARLSQMLMVEEGPQADSMVDVYKLQNFLITILLAAAYIAPAVHTYAGWGLVSSTFPALLAISHAGYVGGKLPNRRQDPVDDAPKTSLDRVNTQRNQRKQSPPRQVPTKKQITSIASGLPRASIAKKACQMSIWPKRRKQPQKILTQRILTKSKLIEDSGLRRRLD